MPTTAILALEDGRHFQGTSFGSTGTTTGEICFNTSMTGYQEVITDPSYRGQIVSMTYPQIGNYGINEANVQKEIPRIDALAKELGCEVIDMHAALAVHSEMLPDRVHPNNEGAAEMAKAAAKAIAGK